MRVEGLWTVWISGRGGGGGREEELDGLEEEGERRGTEETLNAKVAEDAERRGEERRGGEGRGSVRRQVFNAMRYLTCVETTSPGLARHGVPAGSGTRPSVAHGVGSSASRVCLRVLDFHLDAGGAKELQLARAVLLSVGRPGAVMAEAARRGIVTG